MLAGWPKSGCVDKISKLWREQAKPSDPSELFTNVVKSKDRTNGDTNPIWLSDATRLD